MKVHTTEKTFQSSLCDNLFINEKELKIHKKDTQTGEKSFQCTQSDKTFLHESKLNNHIVTHIGEYK